MIDIVVDVGANHLQDLGRALAHIALAVEYGVTATKFQLYTADTLYHKDHPNYHTVKDTELNPAWLPTLKSKCDELGVEFLCTPFYPEAVDMLEELGIKRYKVASGDLTFIPLLEAIGKTHKPVLLSIGFGTRNEISLATDVLWRANRQKPDLTYLYCTGGYPTKPEDYALVRVKHYVDYGWPLGLSSHVREWWTDLMTIPYVTMIEKHFDLDGRGPEAGHSLVGEELKVFVNAVRDCETAWGPVHNFSDDDLYARDNYRRNPVDWLRPATR